MAATTATTMLPADPRHVRVTAGCGAATTHQHDSPHFGADTRTGCGKGRPAVATALEADTIQPRGSIPDRRNNTPHLLLDSSAHSPAFSRRSHGLCSGMQGSAERVMGDGSAACTTQKLETQGAPKDGSPEREEERLMASIARLDTLLREENGEPRAPARIANPVNRNNGGEVECRTARVQMGGVAKSRVRRGSGRETKTCRSRGSVPALTPKIALTSPVPVPAALPLRTDAVVTPISPGMFPPLYNRTPACPGGQPARGRSLHPGANGMEHSGRSQEVSNQIPPSRAPVSRAAFPLSHRISPGEERRMVDRRDGGSADVSHDTYQQRQTGQMACDSIRWVGHNNDRSSYGYDSACAPPRYFVPREGEMTQQRTRTPARYWDPEHDDYRGEGRYDYSGGGGDVRRFCSDARYADTHQRDDWDLRRERGDWTREPPPDQYPPARGRDIGGGTEWVRYEALPLARLPEWVCRYRETPCAIFVNRIVLNCDMMHHCRILSVAWALERRQPYQFFLAGVP